MAQPQDFPRSLQEFFRMFPDEGACLRYVLDSRWPGGDIECPRCAAARSYPREDRRAGRECAGCGHTFSATSGTLMDHTRLPLSLWLQSAYLLVTDKRGLSAKQLQRDLGLRGYERHRPKFPERTGQSFRNPHVRVSKDRIPVPAVISVRKPRIKGTWCLAISPARASMGK